MTEIFFIDDTLTNKISYYLLLAFLVALPFDLFYSELALVCLLIHSLIQAGRSGPFRFRGSLLLIVAVYLITMAGTLYSHGPSQAWKDWEKQLALLLFPLIFSITGLRLQRYKLPLLKAFGLSCLVTVLYLYAEAWLTLRYNGLSLRYLFSSSFMNHNFSMPIGLHATYFSMYIAISLITFTYLLVRSHGRWDRALYGLALLILLGSLLQLASRAVWAAVSIMLVTMPFFLIRVRSARRFIFISVCLGGFLLFTLEKVSTFTDRYIVDLKHDLSFSAEEPGIIEPRVVRWGCAWGLIRASPLIGHGTGTEVALLKESYFDRRLYSSYLHELNAHNEFLSFLLKTGLVGLLVYLALLATGFREAMRSRDVFFYGFLVIVFCVSFSENILDTNKGIFFFSFFFPLFFATASLGKPGEDGASNAKTA